MKTFQYTTRDYTPSIDLEVLGRTYNTLEEGHKEAVKAASDLRTAIGQLDMNEAEDSYKQALAQSIEDTIDENTVFGNSYAALDDIVTKAGDIASNQGVLGRLRAQQDYKAFKDRVENDKTLPQRYKDYYLEKNPYHYEDKFDKNGNVIGGTKWTPNTSPTNVVPLNQLISQGIQWAAREKGEGNVTRFIDANGNITTDPNKAYDGEVFNTTTQQWERLSREKIWQGIRASIDSTPGAKESLKQDYDVAVWAHNKQVEANNGQSVVSEVTDANGKLLDEGQYLFKRIDPAVQAAQYYNSTTTTSYGRGLATYRAAQAKAKAAEDEFRLRMSQATMSGRNTPVSVSVDTASEFMSTQSQSSNAIKELYKNITGRDLFIKQGTRIDNMERLLDKNNVPVSDRIALRNLVKMYNEATDNLNSYTENMSEEDRRKFEAATRFKSGGSILSSQNGGSKFDDKIITAQNALYGSKGHTIKINLGTKTLKAVKDIISGGQYKGYDNLGIRIEGNSIFVPRDKEDVLPMLASIINKAESRANTGFLPTIYQAMNNGFGRYSIQILDANGNDINAGVSQIRYGSESNPRGTSEKEVIDRSYIRRLREIGNAYDDAVSQTEKLSTKYKVNPTTIDVSSLNFDGNNFTEQMLLNQFNKGLITQQEYNANKEYFNKSFDDILSNQDFSQTDMYYVEEGGTKKRVVDSGERFNLGGEILQAIKDKRAIISPSSVAGITDPKTGNVMPGYNITILPKVNNKGEVVGDGKQKRFYIPGLINETASQMMMSDPYIQAWNLVSVTGGTKTTRNILDDNTNPSLGNMTLTGLGQDMFDVSFSGINKVINSTSAVNLTEAINDYNYIKNIHLASGGGNVVDKRQRNTIAKSAKAIGETLGINPEYVLDRLLQDINQ